MIVIKSLEQEEIKEVFKSAKVKISWTIENNEVKEKIFNLGDSIDFK